MVVLDVVQEEEWKDKKHSKTDNDDDDDDDNDNDDDLVYLMLCRRRSGKITSIPRLTTGKSKRQIVPCQSLIIKRLMTSSQKLLRLRLLKYLKKIMNISLKGCLNAFECILSG